MTRAWHPRWLMWSLEAVRNGGLVREGIPSTRALTGEIAATLPGQPVALPTPGHTGGHCSYIVDGVLVAGDRPDHRTPTGPGQRPAVAAGDVQPR